MNIFFFTCHSHFHSLWIDTQSTMTDICLYFLSDGGSTKLFYIHQQFVLLSNSTSLFMWKLLVSISNFLDGPIWNTVSWFYHKNSKHIMCDGFIEDPKYGFPYLSNSCEVFYRNPLFIDCINAEYIFILS